MGPYLAQLFRASGCSFGDTIIGQRVAAAAFRDISRLPVDATSCASRRDNLRQRREWSGALANNNPWPLDWNWASAFPINHRPDVRRAPSCSFVVADLVILKDCFTRAIRYASRMNPTETSHSFSFVRPWSQPTLRLYHRTA